MARLWFRFNWERSVCVFVHEHLFQTGWVISFPLVLQKISTHLRGFKQHTLIVVLLSKSKSKIGLPELKSRSWHSPGPSGSSWEMLFPWLSQAADCPTLWLVALSIFKAHTVDHMFLHGSLLGLLFCSAELLLVHQGTLISRSPCLSSGQVTNNTSIVLQTHLSLIVIYS